MNKGHATKEGTDNFFDLHPVHEEKKRSFHDLSLSAIGLGTYLGEPDERSDEMYKESIITSVSQGMNFIDTAINYRSQRSEKMISEALEELAQMGISREMIAISTKGGYIPFLENQPLSSLKQYIDKGILQASQVVDECHSLAPNFLQDQINRSLKNMKIESIDLYYLHNPEVQLFEISEALFEERVMEAFILLENNVKEGKIQKYGIATWNGFRQKKGTKGLLQLTKLVALAEKIAGPNHHFQAIQLPFNLVMLEAIKIANQESEDSYQTILRAALENNISVIVSAPLMQQKVLHLPERVFSHLPPEESKQLQALQFVLSSPAITSCMVGMKNPVHAKENGKILHLDNWKDEEWKMVKRFLHI